MSGDDLELRQEHYDLLQAISDLQSEDTYPSTEQVGERLLAIYKDRGGPYSFHGAPPWHGTNPMADELRSAGLVDVDPGTAEFRCHDEPATSASVYWLGLTQAGRRALADR